MSDAMLLYVPVDWYRSVNGLEPKANTRWVALSLHLDGSVTWNSELSSFNFSDQEAPKMRGPLGIDGPPCECCGHIMVPFEGALRCLNCGASSKAPDDGMVANVPRKDREAPKDFHETQGRAWGGNL